MRAVSAALPIGTTRVRFLRIRAVRLHAWVGQIELKPVARFMGTSVNRQSLRMASYVIAILGILSCTENSVTGTDNLTSDGLQGDEARVATVSVSFGSASLHVGDTTRATAALTNSRHRSVFQAVTWSSSNPSVATVDAGGLITAAGGGNSIITATSGTASGSGSVDVLAVGQAAATANPGAVTDLAVTGSDTTSVSLSFTQVDDGTGQPAKYDVRYAVAPISWGSAASVSSGTCTTPVAGTAIGATLSCSVTGLRPSTNYNFQLVPFRGTMNMNAVYGPLSNVVAAKTIQTVVPVASVSVTPTSATIQPGATTQLAATTLDSAGNTLTGRSVTWSSSNTSVATVSSSGLVTAIAAGTAQVSATSEGKSGNSAITVSPPPSGKPGTVTNFGVSAIDSTSVALSFTQVDDGSGQPASYDMRFAIAPISWGSAASVTSGSCKTPIAGTGIGNVTTCMVQGLRPSTNYNFQIVAFRGTMNMGAVYGSLSAVVAATTLASAAPPPVPVATVTVAPASSTLDPGGTVQLTATTRDANNNVLTGRSVIWTSANSSVASVNSSGLVTAVAQGSTQITATSEGKTASAAITVNAAPPPPPPPPSGSNEPAGMTLVSSRPFNSTTATYTAGEDGWWDSDHGSLAIIQDASAPRSAPNIARMTFNAGINGGYAPSTLERQINGNTMYVAAWVRYSSNWQSHNSSVNKILHFWIGGGNKLVITAASYTPYGPLTARISLQGVVSGGNNNDGGITGTYNSTAEFVRGQWTKIEVVAVANTPGSNNGSVKLYINGALATQCSGIQFYSGGGPFQLLQWAPVWGGTGDTVQQTMYEDMDHVYISQK
jgi:uncharacterized protein YjdB